MPTLNYTTKVSADRTIAEMQRLLVAHDADAVVTRYENRVPVGLSFRLPTIHGPRDFTLPVYIEGVERVLDEQNVDARFRGYERATWVAWRVLKDWVEAQLALIEAGMATIDQVMLPYLHVAPEITLYQRYLESEQRALAQGSDSGDSGDTAT